MYCLLLYICARTTLFLFVLIIASPSMNSKQDKKHTQTHTQAISRVPLTIAACGRWITMRCLTWKVKASLAILQAQQRRHGAAWHAAWPLCVSHTEPPGEYFLRLLLSGLQLLALKNQQPGFIDLP